MSEGGRFTAEKVVSSATEPLFNGPVSGVWGGGAVLPGGGGALLHSGSIWKRRPPVTVGIFQQQVSLCVWIEGEAGGGALVGGGLPQRRNRFLFSVLSSSEGQLVLVLEPGF